MPGDTYTLDVQCLPDGSLAFGVPADLQERLARGGSHSLIVAVAAIPAKTADQAEEGGSANAESGTAQGVRGVPRQFMEDCGPEGWPPVRMRELHRLCLELDRQERLLGASHSPSQNPAAPQARAGAAPCS